MHTTLWDIPGKVARERGQYLDLVNCKEIETDTDIRHGSPHSAVHTATAFFLPESPLCVEISACIGLSALMPICVAAELLHGAIF